MCILYKYTQTHTHSCAYIYYIHIHTCSLESLPFIFLMAQGMRHSARYTSAKDPLPRRGPILSSEKDMRPASICSIADICTDLV